MVEEKKKRNLLVANKGKDNSKEAHDELISCVLPLSPVYQ
jgi:hypothetical protein